jgi:hypothetical protein
MTMMKRFAALLLGMTICAPAMAQIAPKYDHVTITGTGSTGDVSAMNVGSATLADLAARVPAGAINEAGGSLAYPLLTCDGTTDVRNNLYNSATTIHLLPYNCYAATSVYDTTATGLGAVSLNGPGPLTTLENGIKKKQAANFSTLLAAPTAPSSAAFESAFDGDFTSVAFASQKLIAGASTLGNPSSGYVFTPAASNQYIWGINTSGYNSSTSGNGGRTGAAAVSINIAHVGQGDYISQFCNGYVNSVKTGATSFLASPAISCSGGQLQSFQNGAYIEYLGDMNIIDNGYDISGIGGVWNFFRTNNTGAIGTDWMGLRLQSGGTKSISAFFSAAGNSYGGGANIVVDAAPCGATSSCPAAMTMVAGQKIYGNATNTDNTHFSRYTVNGTEYYQYNASTSAWEFNVAGTVGLSISAAGLKTGGFPVLRQVSVPTTSSTACTPGDFAVSDSFIYHCVTNSWVRSAAAAW